MGGRFLWLGAALIGSLLTAEGALRLSGILDFPLYDANNRIGYIPKPNQSGTFLRRNDWVFNELSMGTAEAFVPDEREDILLVGDSIVLGGNTYTQAEKLGSQLGLVSNARIWPISAGSWGLQNEIEYLTQHPNVVSSVDRIVFILNAADFGQPSSWRSEDTHPRSYPLSALAYLARKYLIKPVAPPTPAHLLVPARDPLNALNIFARGLKIPVDIWLYPDRADVKMDGAPTVSAISAELRNDPDLANVSIHLVHEIPGWSQDIYRDEIHPKAEGLEKLARAIAASGTPLLSMGRDQVQPASSNSQF